MSGRLKTNSFNLVYPLYRLNVVMHPLLITSTLCTVLLPVTLSLLDALLLHISTITASGLNRFVLLIYIITVICI